MTHWKAVAATLALLAAIGYFTLALGLGSRLTPLAQIALWAAVAGCALGLVAALAGRPRLAWAGWGVAVLVMAGILVQDGLRKADMRARDGEKNRADNAALLASAQASAPCANGDVATLQMLHNPGTERYSLSIQIIPADRAQKAALLVSASGQYKPPGDQAVAMYREQSGTDCKSAHLPSLDAMMDRLRAHYVAERPKYDKVGAAAGTAR